MTGTQMFHIGVLVFDLDEAIHRFESLLGVTFNPPTTITLRRLVESEEHRLQVRATYSRQGPPHIELVEAVGEGVYGRHHGEGVHHVGMWQPSLSVNKSRLEAEGVPAVAEVMAPSGRTFAWFTDPAAAHGVRFELIDAAGRAQLEDWIAGGDTAGGVEI